MSGTSWYRRPIDELTTTMFALGLEWPEDSLKRRYFWPMVPGERWTVLSSCSGTPVRKGGLAAIRELMNGDPEFRDLGEMRDWTEAGRHHVEESLAIAFEAPEGSVDTRLFRMTTQIRELLEEFPDFEVLQGRSDDQIVCCGRDSGLVAFVVKDRHRDHQYLELPALRDLHDRLARKKVLLGLPVKVGIATYAMRVAVGAEDVLRDDLEANIKRLAVALSELGFSRLPGRSTEPRPPASREGVVLH